MASDLAEPLTIQASPPYGKDSTEIPRTKSQLRLAYFHSERLEAFCDAVLSIIATILMTPLKFSDEELESKSLRTLLTETQSTSEYVPKFILSFFYFAAVFFFVISAWYRHMKIFYLYPIADNFILWLNIAFLLGCSFLPLATAFLEIGPVPSVLSLLFASSLIIGMVQTIQILYGYSLRESLPSYTDNDHFGRIIILFQIMSYLITPVLLLLVLFFSFINYSAGPTVTSFVLLLVLFSGKVVIFLERIYARFRRRKDPTDTFHLELKKINDVVSKNRVEFFSDGVFAIVGTIVILDTTSELSDLIASKDYNPGKLDVWGLNNVANNILVKARFQIYSYLMSFLLVCLFWYMNHSIFHYVRQMNKLMMTLNMFAQMFVCLIPFCASILVAFANRTSNDLTLAITITCTVLFIISILQLLLWIVVRFWVKNALTQDLEHVADVQMLIRLLLVPTLSLIFIFISAGSSHTLSVLSLFSFFGAIVPALILIEGIYFLSYFITKKYYNKDSFGIWK